jgi:Ca2+-transporting ATPase
MVMVLAVTALQLSVIYAPPLQSFFKTTPLSISDLAVCLGIGAAVFVSMELEKKIFAPQEQI